MKIFLIVITCLVVVGITGLALILNKYSQKTEVIEQKIAEVLPPDLSRYSIENLSSGSVSPGKLKIGEVLEETEAYTSYKFNFEFNPNLDGVTLKSTTGQINLPAGSWVSQKDGNFPVILMLRGYINQETFITGDGTRNASRVFAENGFVTIAPDFLGYGDSSEEAGNIFETRFQTYVTALALLNSLNQLNSSVNLSDKVGLWGHSNGGQIALNLLEITGQSYPTSLWAPVSKPFPYSVLYYTEDSEDGGKLIRRELAKFESVNDTDKFSLTNYLDKINAPIQLQQGAVDDAVPIDWSDELAQKLEDLDVDVTYYKYPNADHNMRPNWDEVVARDIEFFNKHL